MSESIYDEALDILVDSFSDQQDEDNDCYMLNRSQMNKISKGIREMSKELEALQQIKASHFQVHIESENIADFDIWFEEYYNLLLKALTPPTADEVCKALSEFMKQEIFYTNKQFHYFIKNTQILMFVTETYDNNTFSLGVYLPPHLITLIGRFYEGLKK